MMKDLLSAFLKISKPVEYPPTSIPPVASAPVKPPVGSAVRTVVVEPKARLVVKPDYKNKISLNDYRSFQARRRGILGKELRRLIALQEQAHRIRMADYVRNVEAIADETAATSGALLDARDDGDSSMSSSASSEEEEEEMGGGEEVALATNEEVTESPDYPSPAPKRQTLLESRRDAHDEFRPLGFLGMGTGAAPKTSGSSETAKPDAPKLRLAAAGKEAGTTTTHTSHTPAEVANYADSDQPAAKELPPLPAHTSAPSASGIFGAMGTAENGVAQSAGTSSLFGRASFTGMENQPPSETGPSRGSQSFAVGSRTSEHTQPEGVPAAAPVNSPMSEEKPGNNSGVAAPPPAAPQAPKPAVVSGSLFGSAPESMPSLFGAGAGDGSTNSIFGRPPQPGGGGSLFSISETQFPGPEGSGALPLQAEPPTVLLHTPQPSAAPEAAAEQDLPSKPSSIFSSIAQRSSIADGGSGVSSLFGNPTPNPTNSLFGGGDTQTQTHTAATAGANAGGLFGGMKSDQTPPPSSTATKINLFGSATLSATAPITPAFGVMSEDNSRSSLPSGGVGQMGGLGTTSAIGGGSSALGGGSNGGSIFAPLSIMQQPPSLFGNPSTTMTTTTMSSVFGGSDGGGGSATVGSIFGNSAPSLFGGGVGTQSIAERPSFGVPSGGVGDSFGNAGGGGGGGIFGSAPSSTPDENPFAPPRGGTLRIRRKK